MAMNRRGRAGRAAASWIGGNLSWIARWRWCQPLGVFLSALTASVSTLLLLPPIRAFAAVPIQCSPSTVSIAASRGWDGFTLGLKSDGTAWSWGYNAYGQLGNGLSWHTAPTPVP